MAISATQQGVGLATVVSPNLLVIQDLVVLSPAAVTPYTPGRLADASRQIEAVQPCATKSLYPSYVSFSAKSVHENNILGKILFSCTDLGLRAT